MAVYRIFGYIKEESTLYIIQNEEYRSKHRVTPGYYQTIFESNSDSPVTAVAENKSGKIMGFCNIELISDKDEFPNLHQSIPEILKTLTNIQDALINYCDISEEVMDDLNSVIVSLRQL